MELLSVELMAVTALMLTLLLMPLASRLAYAVGAIDVPGGRKVHQRAVPRLAGLAIAVSMIAVCVMFLDTGRYIAAFLTGAVVIAFTGLADDIWQIRPWQKFLGEILATSLFVFMSGAAIRSFGDLVGAGPIMTGSFAMPLTVFCMVGVINALNLSDGLDGLAAGLAAIACLFLGYFAFVSQHWVCLALVVTLFGGILGFLYYNTYPARVFMGDTGSLMLGYVLSAVAVLCVNGEGARHVAPVSMALVLALPIVDTLLVMSRRMYHGYSPFSPDKTHLHHRLLDLGLPHAAVVPILYGCMAMFGFIAVLCTEQPEWLQFLIGLGFAALLFGSVSAMQRLGFQWRNGGAGRERSLHRSLLFSKMTAWTGRSVPVMTWIVPLALVPPVFSLQPLPLRLVVLSFILCLSILAMFPWTAREERLGMAHGLIYLGLFSLLAVYQTFGTHWAESYLMIASILLSLWVVLKLVFKRHGRIFLTSSFELLMIIVSWFVPVFLSRALHVSDPMRHQLITVCLESIPFLLAMKIIIRKQPRRNRTLATSLIGLLFFVGLRGVF